MKYEVNDCVLPPLCLLKYKKLLVMYNIISFTLSVYLFKTKDLLSFSLLQLSQPLKSIRRILCCRYSLVVSYLGASY